MLNPWSETSTGKETYLAALWMGNFDERNAVWAEDTFGLHYRPSTLTNRRTKRDEKIASSAINILSPCTIPLTHNIILIKWPHFGAVFSTRRCGTQLRCISHCPAGEHSDFRHLTHLFMRFPFRVFRCVLWRLACEMLCVLGFFFCRTSSFNRPHECMTKAMHSSEFYTHSAHSELLGGRKYRVLWIPFATNVKLSSFVAKGTIMISRCLKCAAERRTTPARRFYIWR